ncbi:MAG TPA: DNA repair protein RadA [Gemmatimonadales bacterium]|nr:DNA repair protein RadA [Gemmatimonadales bacterium]
MARVRSVYRCAECGHEHPKWAGRCEACGAWNAVSEEPGDRADRRAGGRRGGKDRLTARPPDRLRDIAAEPLERWRTGIQEFDFVLGGGIVPGSMTLIGGEPGIGKSTLLMQAAARLETEGRRVLYASGEESPDQLRLRADRLEEDAGAVHVLGETRLEAIVASAAALQADVVVLDSIQTVYTDLLESAPGNVGQVRECSGQLMRFAKETGTAVVVVGHVTKGGGIAGPKTLEHIVDTVLYFEGESTLDYRLLRATKNRFGSVDELGVFSMTERGLVAVPNPSAVFLAARADGTAGSAITALMEGTRPVLVEVQALAANSGYGTPQRVATGIDPKRLAVLLAVLERRADTSFADLDVFVQVTAGVRLNEPGADLAVAAALLSSLYNRPAPADGIFLGEVGLGGEIRPTGAVERRVAEAARLGFRRVFGAARAPLQVPGVAHVGLEHVDQLVRALAA